MSVSNLNFAAEVSAWVREKEILVRQIFRESAQEVVEEMQTPVGEGGRLPIATGFLRSSLQVSLNSEPVPATRENPGGSHGAPNAASLVIGGAEIGDRIVASYSAVYAPAVEYGARGRPPRGFVRGAAQRWQSIVREVAQRLKGRVAAGR